MTPPSSTTAAPTPSNSSFNSEVHGCHPQEDNTSSFDQQSWVISVTLAVFAALINNFGVNLQKLAWTKKQSNTIKPSVYRTYWLLGMVGIVLASVFDFVALAFGPQSVIAPLGSLTMVANAFVAPWMHGEKLHKHVVGATVIIIIGCATAVAAASHSNNVCDIEALFALYWTFRFMVYVLVLGAIIGTIYMFIKRAERIKIELGEDSAAYMAIFRYHRISYASLSGIFGAQSVLFARTIDLLFVGSTRGGRIFLLYPGTYIVVFCLVGCIFLQLYFLNLGLARFESLYNVPIFTSTWIVGTVLGGGIFYGEFAQFSVAQAILFPLGVFLCCLGVFFLATGGSDDQKVGLDSGQASSARVGDEDDEEGNGFANGAQVAGGGGKRQSPRLVGGDDDNDEHDSKQVDLLGLPIKGSKRTMVFT